MLVSNLRIFRQHDPLQAIERALPRQPALARYLAGQDWRRTLAELHLPWHRELLPLLAGQPALWTHNDWHASNLLWRAEGGSAEVESVLDFGLSDLTFALFDLATALERNCVPWLELDDGGRAPADLDAVDALLAGYTSQRPLDRNDLFTLKALLPLVHADFALAEVDYFEGIVGSRASADIAYHAFLVGHARWFGDNEGARLLAHLDRLARTQLETAMPTHHAAILIAPQALHQAPGRTRLLLLDASVELAAAAFDGDYRVASGEAAWRQEHIPGARHADLLHALADGAAGFSFALPSPAALQQPLARLGVGGARRIVIYDRHDGFWAARLWWMLRSLGIAAAVLDGGLKAWRQAGLPLAQGESPVAAGRCRNWPPGGFLGRSPGRARRGRGQCARHAGLRAVRRALRRQRRDPLRPARPYPRQPQPPGPRPVRRRRPLPPRPAAGPGPGRAAGG